jgi:hypothetical protein
MSHDEFRRTEAIPSMIEWYAERISDLESDADVLTGSAFTHRLGLLLRGEAAVHRQMHEWALRTLLLPCPTEKEDQTGFALWITCLRVLRRHVAVWGWREDYEMELWRPVVPGQQEADEVVFTEEENALAVGLPGWTEE